MQTAVAGQMSFLTSKKSVKAQLQNESETLYCNNNCIQKQLLTVLLIFTIQSLQQQHSNSSSLPLQLIIADTACF